MTVNYELNDARLRRCTEFFEIVAEITAHMPPYRFEQRYPAEAFEYHVMADTFRASPVRELSYVGYWLQTLLSELNETDRVFLERSEDTRACKRQLRMLRTAVSRMNKAMQSLKKPIRRGVI